MGIANNKNFVTQQMSSAINGTGINYIVNDTNSMMSKVVSSKSEAINVLNNNSGKELKDTCSLTPEKTKQKNDPNKRTLRTLKESSSSVTYGAVDKRVSLTAAPKVDSRDERTFASKIIRVLGEKRFRKNWILSGNYFYGLLHNALSGSSGLIFPYTPEVSFQHSVTWEKTDITHSNLSYSAYKNTPVPTINLKAKFTADNRDNALHMLSAIWFLIACTKCEFGEKSAEPGLPPPILYLNGYDHLIDNIPVVISSVGYTYPSDKHYVNLILDMSKDYNSDQDFCKIYDTTATYETSQQYSYLKTFEPDTVIDTRTGETYEEGEKKTVRVWKNLPGTQPTISTHTNGIDLSFWLPTSIEISIGLILQPNLLKTKKQWNLADYKSGLLTHDRGKNPPVYSNENIKTDVQYYTQQVTQNSFMMCKKVEQTEESMDFIPSGWTW